MDRGIKDEMRVSRAARISGNEREKCVFWRGSTTGSLDPLEANLNSSNACEKLPRVKLARAAQNHCGDIRGTTLSAVRNKQFGRQ